MIMLDFKDFERLTNKDKERAMKKAKRVEKKI